jgi:hypothetical protein
MYKGKGTIKVSTYTMSNMPPNQDAVALARYRAFVVAMVGLTSGGPRGSPPAALCAAIEDGTVNVEAVAALLYGYPFESYSEEPRTWPPSS